jgi:uncharacterized membrane protein
VKDKATILGDLRSPKWLYFKAFLLLLLGVLASVILLIENPHVRTALLLAIAIWGFCRSYYFCFYVIEHYIDPNHRYAGLIAFARYAISPVNHKGTDEAAR